MAIVKLTKSKRGVTFVDDEGNVFVTSAKWIANLLAGEGKPLVLLTRMPDKLAAGHFKKSPVYGAAVISSGEELTRANDAMSKQYAASKEESKSFDDAKVEW